MLLDTILKAFGLRRNTDISERIPNGRAKMEVAQLRNGQLVGRKDVVWNQITNAGRDFLHQQGYGTSGVANGLNYIGLTNNVLSPLPGDLTLPGEITNNGLARAQGIVSHTAGTNTTTIAYTFTCTTATTSAQGAALFTAISGGTMNHELSFPQRTLQVGDQLVITFTITLG